MITRFDKIHERDGQTHRQTHGQTPHDGIDRTYRRAAKSVLENSTAAYQGLKKKNYTKHTVKMPFKDRWNVGQLRRGALWTYTELQTSIPSYIALMFLSESCIQAGSYGACTVKRLRTSWIVPTIADVATSPIRHPTAASRTASLSVWMVRRSGIPCWTACGIRLLKIFIHHIIVIAVVIK